MLLNAKEHLGIDLDRSVFVGDSEVDEELANRMNMRFIRVLEDGLANPANRMPTSKGLLKALADLC